MLAPEARETDLDDHGAVLCCGWRTGEFLKLRSDKKRSAKDRRRMGKQEYGTMSSGVNNISLLDILPFFVKSK